MNDALGESARWGDLQELIRLLEMKVDPNEAGFSGHFPIQLASSGGQIAAISLLLSRGADPNLLDKCDGGNALYWCLYASHPKEVYIACCRILIEHGTSWDNVAKNGKSVNELALERGLSRNECT